MARKNTQYDEFVSVHKKEITEKFIFDILNRTLKDWHRNNIIFISDTQSTKIITSIGDVLELNNYKIDDFINNLDMEDLKLFIRLLLNNAQFYFEKMNVSELEKLSTKLSDEYWKTSPARPESLNLYWRLWFFIMTLFSRFPSRNIDEKVDHMNKEQI